MPVQTPNTLQPELVAVPPTDPNLVGRLALEHAITVRGDRYIAGEDTGFKIERLGHDQEPVPAETVIPSPVGRQNASDYVNDLGPVSADKLLISEAYDITERGRTIRIINASLTRLSNDQLRQTMSVIRSYAYKTNGQIFDRFHSIVILPEDHPDVTGQLSNGSERFSVPISGRRVDTTMLVSERILQPLDQRKPRSQEVEDFYEKYFDQYRQPGEPKEGPGAPDTLAHSQEFELLLAHELSHLVLPYTSIDKSGVRIPGPGPTLYSRASIYEHVAELQTLAYKGGEAALAVPRNQREALQRLYEHEYGDADVEAHALAPHYLVCKELDLAAGTLPIRLKKPGGPVSSR